MRTLKIFFISALTMLLCSCGLFKKTSQSGSSPGGAATTRWVAEPEATTDRIRVTTSQRGEAMRTTWFMRLGRAGYRFDAEHTSRTKPRRMENFYMQLSISFTDSTNTISGRYGNIGLNGIAMGQEATEDNIDWKDIKPGTRGWEQMKMLSNVPDAKVEYSITAP